MKNLLTNFRIMAILAVMCGIVSCGQPEPTQEPDKPDNPDNPEKPEQVETYLRADLQASDQSSIQIKVETSGLDSLAYICYESQQDALQASIIFRRGEKLKAESSSTVNIEELKADSKYYFYFAGKTGSKYYDEIVEVEASTTPYVFTDLLTLVEVGKRDYKVHINVPESVENDDTRSIRYAFSCIPLYVSKKLTGMHDTDLLYQNMQVDTRVDKTIDINVDNEFLLDENGEPVFDEQTGQFIQLHEPIVPGEPVLFMAGEFEWGEGYIANWGPAGDGFGYFVPMYDFKGYYGDDWGALNAPEAMMTRGVVTDIEPGSDEHPYWTGAFQKLIFTLDQPDLLDAEIEVRVEDLSAIDAVVTIIPDENVYGYNYCVMDDGTYQSIINLLCGREDWMQWFVSSYFAQFSLMIGNAGAEAVQFSVSDTFFVGPLNEQSDFHVFITARGNEEGTTQKFVHEVFTTKAKVLDPPVINVTAVEDNQHEYEAKFNIKAPNGDIVEAYYGANYVRDWIPELNSGATYASLVQNRLSSEDVKAINSPEGLTISIPSLDGQTTRIAVLGYNKEYTPNILQKGCSAIADCSTRLQHLDPHIDSPLYKELVGDWTATATVYATSYANNQQTSYKKTSKAKITITDAIETPALDQSVYDAYAEFGWSQSKVDGYYEDFKAQAALFNDYRLYYRNRLLCTGWFDKDIYELSRLTTRTAFDLFKATDYQSYDNAELFYDFGPKWYLEVLPDGSVIVPFSAATMAPMLNWPGYSFYVGGEGEGFAFYEANETYPGFPVEISEDMNTITIKPIVLTDEKGASHSYYMNALGVNPQSTTGELELVSTVVTEIVLKRGWVDRKGSEEETLPAAPASRTYAKADGNPVAEMPEPAVRKSMSRFEAKPLPKYVYKEDANVITKEMVDATSQKILRKYNLL